MAAGETDGEHNKPGPYSSEVHSEELTEQIGRKLIFSMKSKDKNVVFKINFEER